MLHPRAEECEDSSVVGVIPNGSLLVWLDDMLTRPDHILDRLRALEERPLSAGDVHGAGQRAPEGVSAQQGERTAEAWGFQPVLVLGSGVLLEASAI